MGSKYFGLLVRCSLSHVQLFATPWMHGPFVHGIFQARILERVAISYSRGSSQPRDGTQVLHLLNWQADFLPLHHLGSPLNCIHQSLKIVYIIPPVFIMLWSDTLINLRVFFFFLRPGFPTKLIIL